MKYAWIIPLLPLASFLLHLLLGRRMKMAAVYCSMALMGFATVFSAAMVYARLLESTYSVQFRWLKSGGNSLSLGWEVNPLNALLLLVVTVIGLAVHIYAKVYMADDLRRSAFYAYLGLLLASMLGLVLSPNLIQLYMCWELLGVATFLLIGFDTGRKKAYQAAQKVFLMMRLGDVSLLVGIFYIFSKTGTFSISEIYFQIENGVMTPLALSVAALLFFAGAVAKSALFPMHAWLSTALEGPRPAVALLHSATTAIAGIYLVATMYPLFAASSVAMSTMALLGGFTAFFAATVALVQRNVKQVLVYITIGQLGYMMLAFGSAGYTAAVFHVVTYAFAMVLLFLTVGNVIQAMAGSEDMMAMGGFWKKMPQTALLFLIGSISLIGFPGVSGFFSRNAILVSIWNDGNWILFSLALVTILMTAFAFARFFLLVFLGKARSEMAEKVCEVPKGLVWPLFPLAFVAICFGWGNTPFKDWMNQWLLRDSLILPVAGSGVVWISLLAMLFSILGLYLAWEMYERKNNTLMEVFAAEGAVYDLVNQRYYLDRAYEVVVLAPLKIFSVLLSFVEILFLRVVNGVPPIVLRKLSVRSSRAENGQVQRYGTVAFFSFAVLLVVFAVIWRCFE